MEKFLFQKTAATPGRQPFPICRVCNAASIRPAWGSSLRGPPLSLPGLLVPVVVSGWLLGRGREIPGVGPVPTAGGRGFSGLRSPKGNV